MKPGIYRDVEENAYHAGTDEPSLSVSGAKVLIDCPARYHYQQSHRPQKREYDFGHAAHAKVLGVGLEIVAIPDDTLSATGSTGTKAAREFIDQARVDGKVPMKATELAVVDAMASAIESHADAVRLLSTGTPEMSFYWRCEETRVLCRGRADWVTTMGDRPVIVDYKTTTNASPDAFRWDAGKYGYHQQDAWYREGLTTLTGDAHAFVFIVQEKTAPYLVSVVELDDEARRIGHENNLTARRMFAEYTTTGTWPGFPGITRVAVPNARIKEMTHV